MNSFRRLQAAQAISLFGDLLAVFAVQSAIVFRMHGTAREASGVFVASLIPSIVLGPIAGVWADRWQPRRVMLVSDTARAVLILLLVGAHSLDQIYTISLLMSLLACFFQPSFSIALSLVLQQQPKDVEDQRLRRIAKLQRTTQAMRLIGPLTGAALAARFGENACYVLDSLSFLLSAGFLWTLTLDRRESTERSGHPFEDCGKQLAEGVRFIFHHADVSAVLFALVGSTLAGGLFGALAPLYVRDLLQAPASTFALAGTVTSIGTLAASTMAARCGSARGLLPAGVASAAIGILVMSAVASPPAFLLGAAMLGAGGAMVSIASSTVTISATPIALRGRVNSAVTALNGIAQAAAFLLAGVCAQQIGIRGVYLCAAGILAAVAAVPAARLKNAHTL